MVDCVKRLLGLQVADAAVFTWQLDPGVADTLTGGDVPTVCLDLGRIGKGASNIAIDFCVWDFWSRLLDAGAN